MQSPLQTCLKGDSQLLQGLPSSGNFRKTKSAFLLNHVIIDNVLVAFEIIHSIKHKKSKRNGFIIVKLDTSKIFGRVECHLNKSVITKMGFVENGLI